MTRRKRELKPIPKFKSEDEEREFWDTHDTTEYFDLSTARFVTFPNLKPSTKTISLRLPAYLLHDLKVLANRQDVPYQSLLKMYLAERVGEEWRKLRSAGQAEPKQSSAPSRRVARGA